MQNSTKNIETDFFEAMKDVTPLKANDRAQSAKPEQTLAQQLKRQALEREQLLDRNYLSIESVEPVAPLDVIEYKKDGVQEGVFKNLRLGKYKIDGLLSLQHYKFEQAREAIFNGVRLAHEKGDRTLLIKHGIGQNSKPFPAFLKSYVNRWLTQIPEVIAFHSAQKHHGGLAAVYVMLKKSSQQKIDNRELNRHK